MQEKLQREPCFSHFIHRLLQILYDIIDILDAYAESDEVRSDPCFEQLFVG